MITGIAIENFKGIQERVELELRPITLLFGANSAGKSTILHALHYAREIFERHNLDADQTISGGEFVDLGGFANFVHRQPKSSERLGDRDVTIRIEMSLGRDFYLPEFESDYSEISEFLGIDDLYSLINWVPRDDTNAAVEITIAWSRLENQPFARKVVIELDQEAFCTIEASANLKEVFVTPNLQHMNLHRRCEIDGDAIGCWFNYNRTDETVLEFILRYCGGVLSPGDGMRIDLSGSGDALPRLDRPLKFVFEQIGIAPLPDNPTEAMRDAHSLESAEEKRKWAIAQELTAGLEALILTPCRAIRDELSKLRYLGPLRETPPRNYQPPKFADPSRWASGLGAWDELYNGPEKFVTEVSEWLGDRDKLNSGYHIERRKFKEIDLIDPLIMKLMNGRAFDDADDDAKLDLDRLPTVSRLVILPRDSELELRPNDVGIGISQVVPVVVTALARGIGIVSIEQPELHLHPKLQAELGDLFIEGACLGSGHITLLETHSELIPLRLMRRIRESSEGRLKTDQRNITSDDVAIYYIETYRGATVVKHLELSENGQLLDPWPNGFFEEGFHERFSE
jgi:hypothetical protein